MNHSFNVEIAKKYGIEKAVLLENFYFWIKKNKANKRNMHEGKVYTYNTAEAFAELFPYIKERKIAQILREMENEDGLLISGQFHNYDRTKSYTLTDYAMSFFEPSNIQNFDNGKSENCTMENQKNVSCLNTDINSDVNSNINTDKGKKPKKEYDIIYEHYQKNYDILFQQGKVQTNKVQIEYGKCGKLLKGLFRNYSVDELFEILDRGMNDKWIVEGGYNLSILLSANQINKLLNGKSTTSQNGGYVNNKRPASDNKVGEIDF
jgi:hypothetical protein